MEMDLIFFSGVSFWVSDWGDVPKVGLMLEKPLHLHEDQSPH
jgi:hypothetical protein